MTAVSRPAETPRSVGQQALRHAYARAWRNPGNYPQVTLVGNQAPAGRGGSHHGTVERKRLLLQLVHLRRTVPHEGPPRAGEQLAEGAHRVKLLREPGAARLLTACRGAP